MTTSLRPGGRVVVVATVVVGVVVPVVVVAAAVVGEVVAVVGGSLSPLWQAASMSQAARKPPRARRLMASA